MTMVIKKSGAVLIESVEAPGSIFGRMKGLLGRASLGQGKGMYLCQCSSIHTFGMQFRLDLIFIDRSLRITKVIENMGPGRVAFGGLEARSVLELETGWLDCSSLHRGDQLELTD